MRAVETSFPLGAVMSMFQMWVVFPRCTSVPVAFTQLPFGTMLTWFALTCMPHGICPSAQSGMDPCPATISARASDAPPFRIPNGWHVRSSTGMTACTKPSFIPVKRMPKCSPIECDKSGKGNSLFSSVCIRCIYIGLQNYIIPCKTCSNKCEITASGVNILVFLSAGFSGRWIVSWT